MEPWPRIGVASAGGLFASLIVRLRTEPRVGFSCKSLQNRGHAAHGIAKSSDKTKR